MHQNAKEELYVFIDAIRQRYSELCENRDVEKFCIKSGIDLHLHAFSSSGFYGAAFVGEKVDTIVLNSNRSDAERFFDFIHEFIHTKKHREEQEGEFTCFDRKQNSFLEWEANEGAAEWIVPYKIFIPTFCKLYDFYMAYPVGWAGIFYEYSIQKVLATKFGVSEMVVSHRIDNLSYEIDQFISGKAIEDVLLLSKNQQRRNGIIATNYVEILALEELKRNVFSYANGTTGLCL